jgi:nitrate/TMAO reductase-like tetraheme cytochrome c subunit
MLVKQTCSQCHTPNVVMSQTFNEKTARKIYQKMLGESADTERGKKIVEYLTTYMGDKSAGEQK